MLEHVDALIAFSGIILLASLLVTVITQMINTGINLRGRDLLWGLKRLIGEIEPSLKEESDKLIRKILNRDL
ncbi:MAG: hypothetical protein JSW07_09850 [bacterium]|nr:MAG: hypothetical protein JSW07_09850 [bacterium]